MADSLISKTEIHKNTYETYQTSELEGSVFNLGERHWGITDKAKAVYGPGLDTCSLVVIYDKNEGSSLLGAIHWRSPEESRGAISEMAKKLKYHTDNLGVGIVRGRYSTDEDSRTIKEELTETGLEVPKKTAQGPNGLFLTQNKQIAAVEDAPQWVKGEINNYYRQQLLANKR